MSFFGGLGDGEGAIAVSGVSGRVGAADLYWHGIDNSNADSMYSARTVTFEGNIHNFDITAAFGGVTGPVSLDLDGQNTGGDFLGLILVLMDLEPGSASAASARRDRAGSRRQHGHPRDPRQRAADAGPGGRSEKLIRV